MKILSPYRLKVLVTVDSGFFFKIIFILFYFFIYFFWGGEVLFFCFVFVVVVFVCFGVFLGCFFFTLDLALEYNS